MVFAGLLAGHLRGIGRRLAKQAAQHGYLVAIADLYEPGLGTLAAELHETMIAHKQGVTNAAAMPVFADIATASRSENG